VTLNCIVCILKGGGGRRNTALYEKHKQYIEKVAFYEPCARNEFMEEFFLFMRRNMEGKIRNEDQTVLLVLRLVPSPVPSSQLTLL
jgi:hypothetical protein